VATQANVLDLAREYFRAGDLSQVELLCRHLLGADPHNAEALNLLGVVADRTGRHKEALAYLRQAILLSPGDAGYHCNLALVYLGLDNVAAACPCYREALRLRPDHGPAHNGLGRLLQSQGRHAEAEQCYREAIRLCPDYANAYLNLALLDADRGRMDQAIASCREALRLGPDDASARFHLGRLLAAAGQTEEAITTYTEALQHAPDSYELHYNLGLILAQQRHYEGAIACYLKALDLCPNDADIHQALGLAYTDLGQAAEAESCYRVAVRLQPENAELHRDFGHLLLWQGKMAEGWAEFEWRLKIPGYSSGSFAEPRWDGGSLAGRTILLQAEQGLGDTLYFVRYALGLQRLGARVVVQCQAPLCQLLERCPGIDKAVPQGAPLPAFDVHAPLLSLPHLLGTRLDCAPAEVPYLTADAARVARWKQELEGLGPGLRVGIVWQGSPLNRYDSRRSVPLVEFEPLTWIPDARLASLQAGDGIEQLAARAHCWPVTDLGSRFDLASFEDAAAVLCTLDLLVTVDTALAHLAGALGRPVWVALPFTADWRWFQKREDSPWYPTARLFRQRRWGEWAEVFKRIAARLRERAKT
jgi:tetratricopeptide (TPR) repeat protein